MLYDGDGKLYADTALGFSEVVVSVDCEGVSVLPTGKTEHSRPTGASVVTIQELIARYGLSDGGTYPMRPTSATPGGSGGNAREK